MFLMHCEVCTKAASFLPFHYRCPPQTECVMGLQEAELGNGAVWVVLVFMVVLIIDVIIIIISTIIIN